MPRSNGRRWRAKWPSPDGYTRLVLFEREILGNRICFGLDEAGHLLTDGYDLDAEDAAYRLSTDADALKVEVEFLLCLRGDLEQMSFEAALAEVDTVLSLHHPELNRSHTVSDLQSSAALSVLALLCSPVQRSRIAGAARTAPVTLRRLAAELPDQYTLDQVAANPNCPADLLNNLALHSDELLVSLVAAHPRLSQAQQERLSRHCSEKVRGALALNPSLSASVAKRLDKDTDLVRRRLRDNPSLSTGVSL